MKAFLFILFAVCFVSCSNDDDRSCTCDAKFQYPDHAEEIYVIKENTPIDCVTGEYIGEHSGPFQPISVECVD